MDAFERASRLQGLLLAYTKQSRRFDEKEGPQALAAADCGIAHGLSEPGTVFRGAAAHEKAVEASLDGAGHAFESCEKFHPGERYASGALPQKDR